MNKMDYDITKIQCNSVPGLFHVFNAADPAYQPKPKKPQTNASAGKDRARS